MSEFQSKTKFLVLPVGIAMIFMMLVLALVTGDDDGGVAGLNTAAVPAEYVQDVLAAGAVCEHVTAPMIAAQIETESNWNATVVNHIGAQGLGQFMPATWKSYGVDGDGDGKADPLNGHDNIASNARYNCANAKLLEPYFEEYDGTPAELILAAYNAGPGAVQKYKGVPPYEETQKYVAKIQQLIPKYTSYGAGGFGSGMVAAAMQQLGVDYSWGGGTFEGPSYGFEQGTGIYGFDCSGLVRYAAYQSSDGAVQLPRTADEQSRSTTPIAFEELRPGDLVAFSKTPEGSRHHIGIYIGNHQIVHAPKTGDVVKVSSLDGWKGETWHYSRITG